MHFAHIPIFRPRTTSSQCVHMLVCALTTLPSVAGRLDRTMANRLPPLGITYAAQGNSQLGPRRRKGAGSPENHTGGLGTKNQTRRETRQNKPQRKAQRDISAVLTQTRKATAPHEPERRSVLKAPTTSRRSRMRTRCAAQLAITLALVSCAAPASTFWDPSQAAPARIYS